jgi:hypothetical protein
MAIGVAVFDDRATRLDEMPDPSGTGSPSHRPRRQ